ncbi:MAG: hypothetical protein AAGD22_15835 [Verrucomicrobiota bacterium]
MDINAEGGGFAVLGVGEPDVKGLLGVIAVGDIGVGRFRSIRTRWLAGAFGRAIVLKLPEFFRFQDAVFVEIRLGEAFEGAAEPIVGLGGLGAERAAGEEERGEEEKGRFQHETIQPARRVEVPQGGAEGISQVRR